MQVTEFHLLSLFYSILAFEYAIVHLRRLLLKIFGLFPVSVLISDTAINITAHVQYYAGIRNSLGHILLAVRLLARGAYGQLY